MEFNGVTWNIMAPVPEPIRYCGQKERMRRVRPALTQHIATLIDKPLDVVVLQESIIVAQHRIVSRDLHAHGFIHESRQLVGKLRALKFVQGGVVVFSRHPILHQDHCIFEGLCDKEDCFAAKGCVYTCLNKQGVRVHVFAVHLNAWESPQSRRVRRGQMHEVRRFMEKQNIAPHEPVMVLGDINVDLYSERKQLQALQDMVECDLLARHPQSHPFTSDPLTNALVGMDDTSAYRSPAYPYGCSEQYRIHLTCMCCPQEWLDHVMISRNHAPIRRYESWVRAVALKMEPFEIHMGAHMKRTVRDVSDHYPVLFHCVFPDVHVNHAELVPPPTPAPASTTVPKMPPIMRIGWVVGLICLLVVGMMIMWTTKFV